MDQEMKVVEDTKLSLLYLYVFDKQVTENIVCFYVLMVIVYNYFYKTFCLTVQEWIGLLALLWTLCLIFPN